MVIKVSALCAALLLSVLFALTAFAGGEPHRHEAGEPVTREMTATGRGAEKENREEDKEAASHDHMPEYDSHGEVKMTEDTDAYVAATCISAGHRELYALCSICGVEIPGTRVREELPAEASKHVAGPVGIEKATQTDCVKEADYYETCRCVLCGKILTRNLISVDKNNSHVPEELPVKENFIAPTCAAPGQYESVIYCKICRLELQRIWKEIPEVDYHISEYSLKRTVVKKEGEGYFLSFADKVFPDLKKADWTPKEELVGKTFAPWQFFAGDGKRRTCVDGEEHCVLCGMLLNPAIPHTWDAGTVITPVTATTPGEIRYTCLIRGCGATNSIIRYPHPVPFVARLLNETTGEYYEVRSIYGNTELTAAEARLVLRYSVGLGNYDKVITQNQRTYTYADADRDGEVTPNDARLFLRAAVGLRTA